MSSKVDDFDEEDRSYVFNSIIVERIRDLVKKHGSEKLYENIPLIHGVVIDESLSEQGKTIFEKIAYIPVDSEKFNEGRIMCELSFNLDNSHFSYIKENPFLLDYSGHTIPEKPKEKDFWRPNYVLFYSSPEQREEYLNSILKKLDILDKSLDKLKGN